MAGEALYEPPFCPLLPPACPYVPCPPPPAPPPPAPMGAPAAFPPPLPPFPTALPCSEAAAPTPAPAPCPPPGRDARRALALRIPIPTEKIVNLPVEDFNALVGRYPLSEPQLALVRDIRRRGKNKVAAQNCRRRKLETIARLQGELSRLGRERERLLRDRGLAERALGALRRDLGRLSRQVLGALRDAAGNPLPPESFALRLAPDGAVCLVPRAARPEPGD